MSFRRDSTRHHAWKNWVAAHSADLIDAGVPDWLFAEELRWLRFLEEGYDLETGWSPNMLRPSQARALHAWIQREYGDQEYRGTLHEIEVYLRTSVT